MHLHSIKINQTNTKFKIGSNIAGLRNTIHNFYHRSSPPFTVHSCTNTSYTTQSSKKGIVTKYLKISPIRLITKFHYVVQCIVYSYQFDLEFDE